MRPSGLGRINRFGRVVVAGELGALLAQPRLQFDDQKAATFLADTQTLLRSKAVDLALNGKQDIDALDRLGCDWCLAEPHEVKELAPAVRPAGDLGLAIGLAEPAKAGVGVASSVRHSQICSGCASHDRTSRRTQKSPDLGRQTDGPRARKSRTGRSWSCTLASTSPMRSAARRGRDESGDLTHMLRYTNTAKQNPFAS